MSKTIDLFRQAHSSRRRAHEVPEVGITLYFPPLTTAAHVSVAEKMGEQPKGTSDEAWRIEKNVLLIIHQAELEDGTKAFAFGEKKYLLENVDYIVMQRMITAMYAAGMPDPPKDVDEGKDGSAKTEPSDSGSSSRKRSTKA